VKQAPGARPDARGLRIALVRSAFNAPVVEGLVAGARRALREAGAAERDLLEIEAPGAFELPLASLAAARSGRFDAVVALGAVIKGDTDHYEHVARAAAEGLLRASLDSGLPVAFGVLTVAEEAQALARSSPGEANKGAEAARAAVAMVHVLRDLGVRRGGTKTKRARGKTGTKRGKELGRAHRRKKLSRFAAQ
jgi:6,7-dimethyl-8-ribityllumazine synthase